MQSLASRDGAARAVTVIHRPPAGYKKAGGLFVVAPSRDASDCAYYLCRDIDPKDTSFIALTIKLDAVFWTRDEVLKRGLTAKGFRRFFEEKRVSITLLSRPKTGCRLFIWVFLMPGILITPTYSPS